MNVVSSISLQNQMVKLYQYKLTLAERLFKEQRLVVDKCAAECAEILDSVSQMLIRLQENSLWMKEESVHTDAAKMVAALTYKEQVEYDIDRESYFLLLAQDELTLQQSELENRRSVIEKYKILIDEVGELNRKTCRRVELHQEDAQEEEFASASSARGVGYA